MKSKTKIICGIVILFQIIFLALFITYVRKSTGESENSLYFQVENTPDSMKEIVLKSEEAMKKKWKSSGDYTISSELVDIDNQGNLHMLYISMFDEDEVQYDITATEATEQEGKIAVRIWRKGKATGQKQVMDDAATTRIPLEKNEALLEYIQTKNFGEGGCLFQYLGVRTQMMEEVPENTEIISQDGDGSEGYYAFAVLPYLPGEVGTGGETIYICR